MIALRTRTILSHALYPCCPHLSATGDLGTFSLLCLNNDRLIIGRVTGGA
jgi:hypothetical protein